MEITNKQKKTRKKMKHKKGRKIEKQIITQQTEAKPVISLHANGLNNSPNKKMIIRLYLKSKTQSHAANKKYMDMERLEVKDWEKTYHENTRQKKAGITISIY